MTSDPSAQVGEEVVIRQASPYLRIATEVIDLSLPHFVSKGLNLEQRALASKAMARVLESLHILETLEEGNQSPVTAGISATGAFESNGHAGAEVSSNGLHIAEIVELHPATDGDQNGLGIESIEVSTGGDSLLQIILSPVHAYDASALVESKSGAGVADSVVATDIKDLETPAITNNSGEIEEVASPTTLASDEPEENNAEQTSTEDGRGNRETSLGVIMLGINSKNGAGPFDEFVLNGVTIRSFDQDVSFILELLTRNPGKRLSRVDFFAAGFGSRLNKDSSRKNSFMRAREALSGTDHEALGIMYEGYKSTSRFVYVPSEEVQQVADKSDNPKAEVQTLEQDDEKNSGKGEPEADPNVFYDLDQPSKSNQHPQIVEFNGVKLRVYDPHLVELLEILKENPNFVLTPAFIKQSRFRRHTANRNSVVDDYRSTASVVVHNPLSAKLGISLRSGSLIFKPTHEEAQLLAEETDMLTDAELKELIPNSDTEEVLPAGLDKLETTIIDDEVGDSFSADVLVEEHLEDDPSLPEVFSLNEWGLTIKIVGNQRRICAGNHELAINNNPEDRQLLGTFLAAYYARKSVGSVCLSDFIGEVERLSGVPIKNGETKLRGLLHKFQNELKQLRPVLFEKIQIQKVRTKAGAEDTTFYIKPQSYNPPERIVTILRNFRYPQAVIESFLEQRR